MKRYKMIVEYMGRDFAGWQRQIDVPTIQGEIEEAIKGFSNQEVLISGSGRTDAGVHARGQVFHVDLDEFTKPMDEYSITKAINAYLKKVPITVIGTEIVHDDFHARFDSVNKVYQYRILNRPSAPALEDGLMWHIGKTLDVDAMHEAAQVLLGKHDFSTFRDSECQAQSPVKTLDILNVSAREYDLCGGREIIIEAQGKSFLHHQVRNIAGTLSLVGLGKWTPQDMKTALAAKDRRKGGPTAPSDGLYLMRVEY